MSDDQIDLSDCDAILSINGIEILAIDGLPDSGGKISSDERVLIRTSVTNIGKNPSLPTPMSISLDGEKHELHLPAVGADDEHVDWHSSQPLSVGAHTVRGVLERYKNPSDPEAYEVTFHVLPGAAAGRKDYGQIKEIAKSRCQERMSHFGQKLHDGLETFQKAAQPGIDGLKGESHADVLPLYNAVMKVISLAAPETKFIADFGGKLVGQLQQAAANAEAQKIAKAKERLSKAVDQLKTDAQKRFMAAWSQMDERVDEEIREAIASVDEAPDLAGKQIDQYWNTIASHIGIPSADDLDLRPVYDAYNSLLSHVLYALDPTITESQLKGSMI